MSYNFTHVVRMLFECTVSLIAFVFNCVRIMISDQSGRMMEHMVIVLLDAVLEFKCRTEEYHTISHNISEILPKCLQFISNMILLTLRDLEKY
jgi:hypothetical protein